MNRSDYILGNISKPPLIEFKWAWKQRGNEWIWVCRVREIRMVVVNIPDRSIVHGYIRGGVNRDHFEGWVDMEHMKMVLEEDYMFMNGIYDKK